MGAKGGRKERRKEEKWASRKKEKRINKNKREKKPIELFILRCER